MAKLIHTQRNAHQTQQAIGAGLGLLGTFVVAIFFAAMLSRVALYVTFLMPILAGMLIAAAGTLGPRRFGFGQTKLLIAMMALGATVAWAGHHVMSYLNLMSYIGSMQMSAEGGQILNAGDAAKNFLHEATGEQGFWAYLTYVGQEPGASASPIGLLGRNELGAVGTVVVAVVELALFIASAVGSMLMRTRSVRGINQPVAMAQLDKALLAQVMDALDERDFARVGGLLAAPIAQPTHFVALSDGDNSSEFLVFHANANDSLGEIAHKRLIPRVGAEQLRQAFSAGSEKV